MRTRTGLTLGLLTLLTYGSLGLTGGYAWYWRSDVYRTRCATRLSAALGLPADIAAVEPRSWTTREFRSVGVWLPERRARAFTCRSALARSLPGADDPYELELSGGMCEISTRTWLRADYRGMVERGLRPGFAPNGPRRVVFRQMQLAFEREAFRMKLENATGEVSFGPDGQGTATVVCSGLNGYVTSQPAELHVTFSARDGGVRIDELVLAVPELPLDVLGLEGLAGVTLRHGRFAGELKHREHDGHSTTVFSGRCADVVLADLSEGPLRRTWAGRCPELALDELRIEDGRPARLRFRGQLTGVALDDLAALVDLPHSGGQVDLWVKQADLSPDGIASLVASGHCRDFSLAQFTQELGRGRMTGRLNADLTDLTVRDNRLAVLKAEVRVTPAGGESWIELELLRQVAAGALGLSLPTQLPGRVEYSALGVRLDAADERLSVLGTHGEGGRDVLTLKLWGLQYGLSQPAQAIDLRPWLDAWRRQGAAALARLGITPTSAPGAAGAE